MNDILLLIVLIWAVGYFGFGAALGSLIHILLAVAIIILLVRIIQGWGPRH